MNNSIGDIGVAPTPSQKKLGLAHSYKCMQMIAAFKTACNETKEFINSLHSRHRGLIYFTAEIPKARHRLKFEHLTERERLAVIEAMRELRELVGSFPHRLSNTDSVLSVSE
ncbi:DUF5347 domain-containing protein [Serratia entomophila]|uniref:DUF5347 domain-containing protein n=1 Tax=Serratia entomophila TaxID=42906 RepID=UPI0021798632|nr:DUF5347 domain-containing protein [Serratia entomophila]CAI1094119.1 Uncharacterised protein [Serratia entomophila]CAI1885130.1 Uncharacterised protein [Serratia entomophila]